MSRGAVKAVPTVKPTPLTARAAKLAPDGAVSRAAKKAVSSAHISSGDKHLEWVPMSLMRISDVAQRSHSNAASKRRIEKIAREFDPDKFGTLTVNLRDGFYYIIDGGHRYYGVTDWFGEGWEDQQLQCWVYEGLTEAQEAEKFLALNDVKPVSGMDKFKQGVVAGLAEESDIDRIVRAADLRVGGGRDAIGCIAVLTKIYRRGGPAMLAATLRIVRDSFGMPGFASKVTEGVGLFVVQYGLNGFKEDLVIARLSAKKGGVVGLLGEAERNALRYDASKAEAVAAAVVDTYNRGKAGPRLSSWWSQYSGSN